MEETRPITKKETISYAIGGFGKNLAYGLVSTYTLYYYNAVLGISAAFVSVLLMAARIFDAFNDPLMGVIVAKTKSRYGKYRPWIFTGALTNAFVLFAMFSVPQSVQGDGLKYVYTGFLITVIPILIIGTIARLRYKFNYFTIMGMLAGTYTDPPALAYANQSCSTEAPAIGYSTVYTLSMFLRIFTAQVIILLCCGA